MRPGPRGAKTEERTSCVHCILGSWIELSMIRSYSRVAFDDDVLYLGSSCGYRNGPLGIFIHDRTISHSPLEQAVFKSLQGIPLLSTASSSPGRSVFRADECRAELSQSSHSAARWQRQRRPHMDGAAAEFLGYNSLFVPPTMLQASDIKI